MKSPVIVTGGFGFIGSNTVLALNQRGIVPYVIDHWGDNDLKWRNIRGLRFIRTTVEEAYGLFASGLKGAPTVIALGASVDTKEAMSETLWRNNVDEVIDLQEWTIGLGGRFIYASSGATYGAEEKDFRERLDLVPMCPYAATKLYLDQHFFGGKSPAPNTYGLRFMNVFGPREAHKGDMASLVTKGLLKKHPLYSSANGVFDYRGPKKPCWSLFESPAKDPIRRDFIYAGDVAGIILHFVDKDNIPAGVYNVGTGTARSFENLVKAIDSSIPIQYTPIPATLANQYQRYTCADITKLREAAQYTKPFTSLEKGVKKTREWMVEEGLIT